MACEILKALQKIYPDIDCDKKCGEVSADCEIDIKAGVPIKPVVYTASNSPLATRNIPTIPQSKIVTN